MLLLVLVVCAEVGLSHVVLDRASSAGDFWSTFPRSGQLISFNKRYTIYDDPEVNLRWDWNSLLTDVRPSALLYGNPKRLTHRLLVLLTERRYGIPLPQLQQKALP